MFKKVLVVLLTIGLLIPSLPAGAAPMLVGGNVVVSKQENSLITEEKALASFRNTFPNQTRGVDLECEYQDWQRNGHPSWSIRIKGYDTGMRYRNNRQQAYVGGLVDAITGEVLELTYRPSIEYYRERNLFLNREQALSLASELLKKMHPDKINQLKLNDTNTKPYFNGFQNNYTFMWERVSAGTLVYEDGISIGIDAYSGMMCQYNYSWHDKELPQADNILDAEKLMDKLLQEPGLYLSYNRNVNSSGLELIPVYNLNTTASYVDAISGTLLDSRGNPIAEEKTRLFKESFSPADPGRAIKETVVSNKISVAEAMNKAQEFFSRLGYDGEIRQSGSGSGGGYGVRNEYWCFTPKLNTNDELKDMSVAIDAFTGDIRGFNFSNRYITVPAAGEEISPDKALDIALDCIKRHHPEKANSVVRNLNMEIIGGPDNVYYIYFARLVNGLPLSRDIINVEIEKNTGKVLNYHVEWYPVQYEPLQNIITEEKAVQLFKDKLPLELVWIQQRNENYEGTGKSILAYRLPSYQSLNAITGENFYSLYEFEKKAVSNNMAPAIALLYENGLIDNAAIEQPVNRHQALIALMAAVLQGYSPDSDNLELHLTDLEVTSYDVKLYKQAVAKKVIPNQGQFTPRASLSREELAIWSVKTLGLDEIGRMKNSIAVPFNDADKISPGNQNYIGLAYGLGLIKPDTNGNINPDQAVTWDDLATSVTRIAVMPLGN